MLKETTQSYREALLLWLPLVASHLFIRVVSAAILVPLIGALLGFTLSFSDQSALTDQDIARFLLTPAGALGALATSALILVALVMDVAVMTAVIRSGRRSVMATLQEAVGFLTSAFPRLVIFAGHFLMRVLVVALPILALGAMAAAALLRDYDINYYLAFRPPSFKLAVGIGACAMLVLAVLLLERLSSWALALHYCVFVGQNAKKAFEMSRLHMQGQRAGLGRKLVFWGIIRVAAASVVLAITGFLLAEAPQFFSTNLRLFFAAVAALLVLFVLANSVLNATANGALADILNVEFNRSLAGRQAQADRRTPSAWASSVVLPLGVLAVSLASLLLGGFAFNTVGGAQKVDVIGHRGAAASRPENTMAAVVKAIEDGADWVEIDVQETVDGQVIVVHDSDFMKAAGVPLKVWDATMDDIAEIDIGTWFDPAYATARVPLLRDVLATVKDSAKLIIELKYYGHDVDLENRVIALVEDAGMEDQIATMSLKYPAVQKMLTLRPAWRTGVLAATAVGNMSGLDGDFLAVSASAVSTRLLAQAELAEKDVYAWTVNDPVMMSRMISLGVHGLITDEPKLAGEVVGYHQTLTTAERFMLRLGNVMGLAFDLTPAHEDDV